MLTKVCNTHKLLYPAGGRCPSCPDRGKQRRAARNRELGRDTPHWKRISLLARRRARGVCECGCGTREDRDDPATKLTVDLPSGGDHARARLDEVVVLTRRCHGTRQGGRRR